MADTIPAPSAPTAWKKKIWCSTSAGGWASCCRRAWAPTSSYTRKDDTFIPLETRTSIANQEQADLFVSIHANSSRDRDARGVETYYLNFTSSAEALDVAARENAASEKSIHELQDLVKKIALKEKIEESREFASNVQRALHSGLSAKSPESATVESRRRHLSY